MTEALYRKYRPQIFEEVVGQEPIERTIKNAIAQNKVSHAYLFTGPRGTGKTTTARLLAKALLCEHGPTAEPDGSCDDCIMIARGEHPDVYELDAASRTGVENVREEIIGRVQFAPTRGRSKIYIIDEVHMLSTAAFNALLKTLEEPPSHVVFILATTDPQKVPETIHSRCQRFDFHRISAQAIAMRLEAICTAENVSFEKEALDLIAQRAEGGMRDALTSLEQLIAFGEGSVTQTLAERLLGAVNTHDLAEIMRALGTRDAAACFRWTAEYVETGADLAQFTRDLAQHIRNMYVLLVGGDAESLKVDEAMISQLKHESQWFEVDRLARMLSVLGDLLAELKSSTNPLLSFEIALTRMVRPHADLTLASLAERIACLEKHLSQVSQPLQPGLSPTQSASTSAEKDVLCHTHSGTEMELSDAVRAKNAHESLSEAQERQPNNSSSSHAVSEASSHTEQDRSREISAIVPDASGAPVSELPAVLSSACEPSSGPELNPAPELAQELANPATLQRKWQSALTALKKNSAAYGVLFLNTRAVYDAAEGVLFVEFPFESSFAFKAVQKPEVMDALNQAIRQAWKVSLPCKCRQRAPKSSAQDTPLVAKVNECEASPSSSFAAPKNAHIKGSVSASGTAAAPSNTPGSWEEERPPYDDEAASYCDAYDGGAPQARESSEARQPVRQNPTDAREKPRDMTSNSRHDTITSSPSNRDGASSADNLGAILAAGFGEGVVVEEVHD